MGKRVLVVDDALISRKFLGRILAEGGHEVVGEASNGREAVRIYPELLPDIVTMDITMPDMNGIQALKEIRKIDPKAKVVMCTAMGQKYLILEAIQAGAVDFLVKPFEKEVVLEAFRKLS
ncbi:two-component system chemotaxis response regulator CheY [Hydrogenispora ethanolica]|jgi:two-component system chemotaxis response regulator CheY|uniref:Two-component system chemotaxis response regulator CheY n=1 Tax=Hydrogenispora ethanolica TaxID=1082276 RepID=A0A4R1RD51_HYDET|nr:response regulator [Hydrogenispora ethanolica]TCL63763.1 two-component system chemotaxis response regulator CheY [Hydrogenispora ethanolica]